MLLQATPDDLRAAGTDGAAPSSTSLPPNLPPTALNEATRVTAGLTTSYDKLIALQNYFSTFDYDLDGLIDVYLLDGAASHSSSPG
jgi:transglutaminase-like putative cysteine protease